MVSVALVKQSGAGPEMHPVDVFPFAWKGMDWEGVRQRAYATDQLGRPNPPGARHGPAGHRPTPALFLPRRVRDTVECDPPLAESRWAK